MSLPIKTISPIGNNQRGFTFIEVMVTLVVLSGGIVMIYKSFFLCLDYLTRLSSRLHASALIDQQIADIQIYIGQRNDTGFAKGPVEVKANIQGKPLMFEIQTQVKPYHMEGLWEMNVDVAWNENKRRMHISRLEILSI